MCPGRDRFVVSLVAVVAAALVALALFASRAGATDHKLVYIAPITDYKSADLKAAYKAETGKEIEKDKSGQEPEFKAAGKPRPELRKEVAGYWAQKGFTVTDDKDRVRQGNGAIVQMRILDDKAIKALNEEGAATVILLPVVGFFLALEKQARVQMRCDVATPEGENVWTGERKKTWKSDFLGGLFTKQDRLRRGARGDCIKGLADDYMIFANGKEGK